MKGSRTLLLVAALCSGGATGALAQDRGGPATGPSDKRTTRSEDRAAETEQEKTERKRGTTETAAAPSILPIEKIDPDALLFVQRQLAIRGYNPGPVDGKSRPELERALRRFASDQRIETPSESGSVAARTIDELGAGPEVAKRWGSTDPRGSDLQADEIYRMNYALAARGYRGDRKLPSTLDATLVSSLKQFQRETGHPVQLGNYVARRWLFILGVATPESCPAPTDGTVPAGASRESGTLQGDRTREGTLKGSEDRAPAFDPAVPVRDDARYGTRDDSIGAATWDASSAATRDSDSRDSSIRDSGTRDPGTRDSTPDARPRDATPRDSRDLRSRDEKRAPGDRRSD